MLAKLHDTNKRMLERRAKHLLLLVVRLLLQSGTLSYMVNSGVSIYDRTFRSLCSTPLSIFKNYPVKKLLANIFFSFIKTFFFFDSGMQLLANVRNIVLTEAQKLTLFTVLFYVLLKLCLLLISYQ